VRDKGSGTTIRIILVLAVLGFLYLQNGPVTFGGLTFSVFEGARDDVDVKSLSVDSLIANSNDYSIKGVGLLNPYTGVGTPNAPPYALGYAKHAILVDGVAVKVCGDDGPGYDKLDRVNDPQEVFGCAASIPKSSLSEGTHNVSVSTKISALQFSTIGISQIQYAPSFPEGYGTSKGANNIEIRRVSGQLVDISWDYPDIYTGEYAVYVFDTPTSVTAYTVLRGKETRADIYSNPRKVPPYTLPDATAEWAIRVDLLTRNPTLQNSSERVSLKPSESVKRDSNYGQKSVLAPPPNGDAIHTCDGSYLRCVGTSMQCDWEYARKGAYSCTDDLLSQDEFVAKHWNEYDLKTYTSDVIQLDVGDVVTIFVPTNLTPSDCSNGQILNNKCYVAINGTSIVNNTVFVDRVVNQTVNQTVTRTEFVNEVDFQDPLIIVGIFALVLGGIVLAKIIK